MFKRDKPYSELSPLQVATLVGQENLKPIPQEDWPPIIKTLIEDCCRFKPEDRIQDFDEIRKN